MDVYKNFDRFLKDLSTLTNKHAHIIKRSRKEMKLKDKLWIDNKIQKMMRTRDKILLKLKKKRTHDNVALYKKFRNRVSNEIKKSKESYVHNIFATNTQNMKKLWSGIKTIISHKSSTSSSINKIKDPKGNVTPEPSKFQTCLMISL